MGVFSELKPKNNARKNPFDLSCFSTYNAKCGMALPLKFWPTLPNSEYELDLKALMRTQPLNTAAFAGFTFNYDVVWTPYNDHYSSFNQFIAQRLNKQHTTQPDITFIPSFELSTFIGSLINLGIWDFLRSEVTIDTMVKYHDSQLWQFNVNPNYTMYSEHLPEESMILSCFRSLDLLEYGNFWALLKQIVKVVKLFLDNECTYVDSEQKQLPYIFRYAAFLKNDGIRTIPDLTNGIDFMVSLTILMSDTNAFVTSPNSNGILKLMTGKSLYDLIVSSQVELDLWSIMCYNKAWWQFYRNEFYDEKFKFFLWQNNGTLSTQVDYVTMFNCDDVQGTLVATPGAYNPDFERLVSMFCVKPHQYKKDLFTGLLPSTQFGSVSVASADDIFAKLISNSGSSTAVSLVDRQVFNSPSGGDFNVLSSHGSSSKITSGDKFKFDPAPMISVLELRRADSLQRFKERMLRAGNRTKDIFEAHGWEQPMSEKAFEAEFYGTFDGRLNINVVASTNDSQEVSLGQLGANGVGAIGGNKIRFKSHDFGTLLVIAYITKDAVYDAYGVHKSHTLLEPFDFPYPELQNVSLSPIARENLFVNKDSNTAILGYLPQNMAYKTANDLVHGEFFTVPFADFDIYTTLNDGDYGQFDVMGIFSNMVTPRLDISEPNALSFFYIQPSCADNIFVVLANGLQDSDQFFGNVHFDLKAVQPLDVIGLPI